MLYEIVAPAVTVAATPGLTPDGEAVVGRHWSKGSIVELDGEDAESLLASGAIVEKSPKK